MKPKFLTRAWAFRVLAFYIAFLGGAFWHAYADSNPWFAVFIVFVAIIPFDIVQDVIKREAKNDEA